MKKGATRGVSSVVAILLAKNIFSFCLDWIKLSAYLTYIKLTPLNKKGDVLKYG